MGTSYSAIPIDQEAAAWLQSQNLPTPASFGRPATSEQLREALESLDDLTISIVSTQEGWDANIKGVTLDGLEGHTTLWVKLTNPNGSCTYHFHKGWPEIAIQVLHHVVSIVGPHLFVPHDTGEPLIVTPDRTLGDTLRAFRGDCT